MIPVIPALLVPMGRVALKGHPARTVLKAYRVHPALMDKMVLKAQRVPKVRKAFRELTVWMALRVRKALLVLRVRRDRKALKAHPVRTAAAPEVAVVSWSTLQPSRPTTMRL